MTDIQNNTEEDQNKWMAHVHLMKWSLKDGTISFQTKNGRSPASGWKTMEIVAAESVYPRLRQAIRVANVSARSDEKRAKCMVSWSTALLDATKSPVYFYRRASDGVSRVYAVALWETLYSVETKAIGIPSSHLKLNFRTSEVNKGRSLFFNRLVMAANFPGLLDGIDRCDAMGFSDTELARVVKEHISAATVLSMALPSFEIECTI
jgi:hypothetical protein